MLESAKHSGIKTVTSDSWNDLCTLIAKVRTAAITSRSPLRTRLSGKVGSKSHIALVVCTAAILVIWAITATCKIYNVRKAPVNQTQSKSAMTTSNVLLTASGSHPQAMEEVRAVHEPP